MQKLDEIWPFLAKIATFRARNPFSVQKIIVFGPNFFCPRILQLFCPKNFFIWKISFLAQNDGFGQNF